MSFAAKYPGRCAYGCRIEPGDECVYTDGELAHIECDTVEGAANIHQPKQPSLCPDCRLQHAGECP